MIVIVMVESVAIRVSIRVAIRNPKSQPEGPKIRNPEGFSMVEIRVANRVANRVSIAILQQGIP